MYLIERLVCSGVEGSFGHGIVEVCCEICGDLARVIMMDGRGRGDGETYHQEERCCI
jgi:hypothetical protein